MVMQQTFRNEKMAESIRKVVCARLTKYNSPIPGAIITINKVYLAKDLFVAKIFFSVFGATLEESAAMAVMNELKGEFRHEISQKLNFRHTPRIEFCFDKNTEYASKIQGLLQDPEP